MGRAALGFCARTGSATAIAIDMNEDEPRILGRWAVDLTDDRVPAQVFHAVEGRDMSTAAPFVERAMEVVRRVAVQRLAELVGHVPGVVAVVAVGIIGGNGERHIPIAKALTAHPLMHAAEGALYREALVDAAAQTGLAMTQTPRRRADELLQEAAVARIVAELGAHMGPPWRKEHKRAAVAPLVALRALSVRQR